MWVYDLGTFEFLDVNEAVIKKYGYTKKEFKNDHKRDMEERILF
jgi:hypothetical protein